MKKQTTSRSLKLMALAVVAACTITAYATGAVVRPAAADRATVDREFIDMMMMHHRQGIEMARLAESKGQLPRLKEFAARVIADQEKDIQELQAMRDRMFSGQPQADGITMRGKRMTMAEMRHMSETDKQKLDAAPAGAEFDHTFLDLFTKHHRMALDMARAQIGKGQAADLKRFSRELISKQSKDISEMAVMKKQVASSRSTAGSRQRT